MTVKARVSGVITLCWHASPSTMYTHSTAAEAEGSGGVGRGSGGGAVQISRADEPAGPPNGAPLIRPEASEGSTGH
eukprot:6712113-Pyramimonas_sp.AAC.1